MPAVIDLTIPKSLRNAPFNPRSDLNLVHRDPKRPREDDSEVRIVGHFRPPPPPPIVIPDDPEPKRRKVDPGASNSRQGSYAGSSRSQSVRGSRPSTPSMPRPPSAALKRGNQPVYEISSDSDEEQVAKMVKPKCSTPHRITPRPTGVSALPSTSRASQMPLPARANALPSTSSAARKPLPTRVNAVASASTSRVGQNTPPARVGPPVFYNLQNIGIQDRETLEILTVQEYEDLLPPFNNPYRWRPIPSNPNAVRAPSPAPNATLEDESEDDEEAEAERAQKIRRDFQRPRFEAPQPVLDPRPPPGEFLARDQYQSAKEVNRRRMPKFQGRPTSRPGDWDYRRPPLKKELDLDRLRLIDSFKQCPGSITCVQQSSGYVAVAGACTGGMQDSPDEMSIDPYNRAGSLMTFFHQRAPKAVIFPGHHKATPFFGPLLEGDDPTHETKYYGLTDVQFCPLDPTRFVTSGNDRCVRFWQQKSVAPWYDADDARSTKLASVPNSLLFKPGTLTLAVAEETISILDDITFNGMEDWSRLKGIKAGQVVGEMRWGIGSTEDFLFASSEPIRDKTYTESWHRIYDVKREEIVARFPMGEAGDAMALDAVGDRLAIVTCTSQTNSNLRIFDVRTKDRRPTHEIELEPFHLVNADDEDEEGEHRDAQFSPDGVFIALARSDNRVHVYDTRFLKSRGLLYAFQHSSATKINPGLQSFGVAKLEWVWRGARMGLVSGGSDGCVRLWDPLVSAEDSNNGKPIATVNSDIASFTLGDRSKGEHQLVVGDCAGEVSIFDRVFDIDFPYT